MVLEVYGLLTKKILVFIHDFLYFSKYLSQIFQLIQSSICLFTCTIFWIIKYLRTFWLNFWVDFQKIMQKLWQLDHLGKNCHLYNFICATFKNFVFHFLVSSKRFCDAKSYFGLVRTQVLNFIKKKQHFSSWLFKRGKYLTWENIDTGWGESGVTLSLFNIPIHQVNHTIHFLISKMTTLTGFLSNIIKHISQRCQVQ